MTYYVQDLYDAFPVAGAGVDWDSLKVVYRAFSFGELLKRKDAVVMQYTGLTDAKGKEIYEGDIGRYDSSTGVVFWDFLHGRWWLSLPYPSARIYWDDVEIIGNVFENPELT